MGSAEATPARPASLTKQLFRFSSYSPKFRHKYFWAVQGIVLLIAGVHDFVEVTGLLPHLGALYFLPITLFFIPVIYAAFRFGFFGSIATVVWITLITIPNWVLWHHGMQRWGVIFQITVLSGISLFAGHWVDREKEARQRARDYAARVVRAQEEERRKVAKDLHDDTIQSLLLVCRQLDSIKEPAGSSGLSQVSSDGLQRARSSIEDIVGSIRNFIKDLRPPILDDLGLVASVRRMTTNFRERTGVDCSFTIEGEDRRLDADLEVDLFRIVQESLWNVEKHAHATKVSVVLSFGERDVKLEVNDNGVGFAVPQTLDGLAGSDKLGLIGMSERAEQRGGRLEILSVPGTGSRILCTMPTTSEVPSQSSEPRSVR